jgi:hypothetical protein
VTNFSCRAKPIRPIDRAAVRRLTWSGLKDITHEGSPNQNATSQEGRGLANALGGVAGVYLLRHIVRRKLH